MKLLIAFFKDKTREISLYAGKVGIFIVVAFLYNIIASGRSIFCWNGLRKARRSAQKNFQSAGIFWNWIIRNYWGSLTKRFWS